MGEGISLLELNTKIQESLKKDFLDEIWIIAEISELKTNSNGHCYLELVEKDKISDRIVAKNRATIWAYTFRMLKPYFENTTGQVLNEGIKIMVKISVEFHEIFGLSLNIKDIDPGYTIGDLLLKKNEIIKRLTDEGIISMNKELNLPVVLQKIAIISSSTAAGYQDFINQLENNEFGFAFYHKLFQATMQGDTTETSIISALEKIYPYEDFFDAVVIIRGGGSASDLNAFNEYQLGLNIAQFPLPVLTGIGHEKDESIADIVAHKKLKTPTATAEFIIDHNADFLSIIQNLNVHIVQSVRDKIHLQNNIINLLSNKIINTTTNKIFNKHRSLSEVTYRTKQLISNFKQYHSEKCNQLKSKLDQTSHERILYIKQYVNHLGWQFNYLAKDYIKSQHTILNIYTEKNNLLNPKNILKRGYSITYKTDKKVVKKVEDIEEESIVSTKLYNGEFTSKISSVKKKIRT